MSLDLSCQWLHPADLVFAPTLAHWGFALARSHPLARSGLMPDDVSGRCGLPLEYAMLTGCSHTRLRGPFRPHLPWARRFPAATTDPNEASEHLIIHALIGEAVAHMAQMAQICAGCVIDP